MRGFGERRRLLMLLLVAAVLAVAAGSAIGAARLTEATSNAGRSITAVRTASDTAYFSTADMRFFDVPNATATINVPARGTGLILIRFTASSACDEGENVSCLVRAEINGTDAPSGVIVWDSVPTGYKLNMPKGVHSMDWSAGPFGPGSYTVQMQAAVTQQGGGAFIIEGWHLTVERVKV